MVTDRDRADIRTAYRPLIEALAGKPGTVSYGEWAAAVDRAFPANTAVSCKGTGAMRAEGEPPPNPDKAKVRTSR